MNRNIAVTLTVDLPCGCPVGIVTRTVLAESETPSPALVRAAMEQAARLLPRWYETREHDCALVTPDNPSGVRRKEAP